MTSPQQPEESVTLYVNGVAHSVAAHRTVAAALMLDVDKQSWRTTRFEGRPRGVFCGIGICFDCLVTVDDASTQRACLVQVEDGMQIRTEK